MTTDAPTRMNYHPASTGETLRKKLSSVRGLRLKGTHRARFSIGKSAATVVLDGYNDLRLKADCGRVIRPQEALATTLDLPGNLRFAIGVQHIGLVADVHLGDAGRIGAELKYVGAGLRWVNARGRTRRSRNETPLSEDDIKAALRPEDWDDQSIVKMADGWELRPRLDNEPVPVKLTIDGPEVHVRRVVVRKPQDDRCADAVTEQALRFNALMKHARLAALDEQVVADARIHRTVLTGDSLRTAARAVAVGERRVHEVLEVLATQEEIAQRYSAMFMTAAAT